MEVPGPDSDWRSPQFRQKVVAQIEEAMRKAGTAHTKSSNDMENHVYVKAKSREEYLSLVARLIIHFRDIHKKTLGGPVGGPGQMPMQQMVQTQQQQQQQSIQFQQFQQAQQQQQQQQQQNAAIQQQFQVQQQLRVQQMQQQHHQNQQLQQQHQNQQQQQAQNQQQQNQSQKGNNSTSGASTPSAAEAAHTDVAADSRRPADIQPTAPSDEVISQPSSVSQAPDSAPKRKRSKDEDPNLLQNSDEFSRFGQTVADMLRRLPKERRDQAMFHIHKVLLERQNP